VSLSSPEQLRRLAAALKEEIAPEVGDEYPRTQAFMASVILQRVAREVELTDEHRDAEVSEVRALAEELTPVLRDAPPEVRLALEGLDTPNVLSLRALIPALYGWGADEPAAQTALARIRDVLRADIDRRMEIAT